jgi:UDPglucose 6-dehydrogenase
MNFFSHVRIGIIGLGFVGNAIRDNISSYADLVCIDTDSTKGYIGTYDDLKDCDGVFICVPSPSDDQGNCDTSILESVLRKLEDFKGVIISKVTAPPDAYSKLSKEYDNLVYSPEFLTARNASRDYAQQTWVIIGGGTKAYQHEAARLIKETKSNLETVTYCSIEEASLVKYLINSYLATKVVFMNELAELAQRTHCDWKMIQQCMSLDNRIGPTHTDVPGHDGFKGFGGHCFPKDTSALIQFAENNDVSLNILKEAVRKNLLLRLT